MPMFEVYFFGLVCHVGATLDRRSHAVLVEARGTNHDPLIFTSHNGQTTALASGDNVSFPSLRSGDVTTGALFNRYVPSIRDLVSGNSDLIGKVKSKSAHNAVVSYVFYPAGDLIAVNVYPGAGRYELNGVPVRDDCVARLTCISVNTPDANVTIEYGDNEMTVPSSAWVLISNSSPSGTTGHFDQYKKLTRATAIANATMTTQDCTGGTVSAATRVGEVIAHLTALDAKGFAIDAQSDAARRSTSEAANERGTHATARITATDIECSNSRWP